MSQTPTEPTNSTKYEYDVFICYRHDDGIREIAKSIYETLTTADIKVYWDGADNIKAKGQDRGGGEKIKQSKWVIVLLTKKSFQDINKGDKDERVFYEELKFLRERFYAELHEKGKTDEVLNLRDCSIIPWMVDGTRRKEFQKDLPNDFKWIMKPYCLSNKLGEEDRENLKKTFENEIEERKKENVKLKKRVRVLRSFMALGLIFALLLGLSFYGIVRSNQKNQIVFVGGSSAYEALENKGIKLEEYGTYIHMPSRDADIILAEQSKLKSGYIPVLISAGRYTDPNKQHKDTTYCLLEMPIPDAPLKVVLWPCTDSLIEKVVKEASTRKKLSLEALDSLVQDTNTYIFHTAETSGTFEEYKVQIPSLCDVDSKRTKTIENNIVEMNSIGRSKRIVCLLNEPLCKITDFSGENVSEYKVTLELDHSLPLYLYIPLSDPLKEDGGRVSPLLANWRNLKTENNWLKKLYRKDIRFLDKIGVKDDYPNQFKTDSLYGNAHIIIGDTVNIK
jgi:hypothetical protein